jgi:hypothetical protein
VVVLPEPCGPAQITRPCDAPSSPVTTPGMRGRTRDSDAPRIATVRLCAPRVVASVTRPNRSRSMGMEALAVPSRACRSMP